MKASNLKWWARKNLKGFRLLNKIRLLCTRKNSYLYQKGWIKTILRGHPCDKKGDPLPWMNYSFISFIEERVRDDFSIIEFGGGYSTIFWSKKAKAVFGIEHEEFFVDEIRPKLPDNGLLLVPCEQENQTYEEMAEVACKLNDGRKFDLLIIDGIRRNECFEASIPFLKDDGVVIWDDSSRGAYDSSFQRIHEMGFKKISFEGLKPGDRSVDETSIFYREENCLNL